MLKINFPESLSSVLWSVLTDCYQKNPWMIYIPAESLTPNHIFLSDLTLITITTSTNYILFQQKQQSTGDSYISDFLIYIHFPSLLAGLLTARVTNYHLKHQTGTKLSQCSLHKAGIIPCLL